MKGTLAFLLFFLLYVPATLAQSTATFVGKSLVNTFGTDGSYIPLITSTHPSYATVTPSAGIQTWTWPNGTTVWYQNSGSFSLSVNMTGTTTHEMTLYMLDYDPASRAETLTLKDSASSAVLDTQSVSDFSKGVYYSWVISGNITVAVQLTGGLNPVVSGLFFDSPMSTGGCPTRTHVVNLAWNTVSGANSYKIYKNGTLVGTSAATSYSETGVSAGANIIYGISAIINGIESQITSSTVSIPSP